jgi:hypothetical protein
MTTSNQTIQDYSHNEKQSILQYVKEYCDRYNENEAIPDGPPIVVPISWDDVCEDQKELLSNVHIEKFPYYFLIHRPQPEKKLTTIDKILNVFKFK